MDETPEEILARLQRYVDSLKAREASVPPTYGSPAPARVVESRTVDTAVLTAEPAEALRRFSTVSRTIAGQMICVATCVVTIVLWINVSHMVSYAGAFVVAMVLGVGVARRVPFTGWALIGLALGLLLGRFS